MTATRDFWAHVSGPRAADFIKVFGRPVVALRSPASHLAQLPGFEEPQEIYLLDLDWVAEQGYRPALVDHLARRFGIPADEISQQLDEVGMPILASDVTLRIDHPQKWFA